MTDESLDTFIDIYKIKKIKKVLEKIKMLQVNFIMICIIHNILVSLIITRICWKIITFSQHIIIESSRLQNVIKDVRNLFRLNKPKSETNDAWIEGIRNLFRLEKK